MLWKTPTFSNYPVLAVIRQHAFSPLLFTATGKQPVRVLAPFDEIALPEGLPWSLENLAQPETDVPVIRQWKTRVDYVIEMAPGRVPVPLASQTLPELELIAAEGFARLYRVRKP